MMAFRFRKPKTDKTHRGYLSLSFFSWLHHEPTHQMHLQDPHHLGSPRTYLDVVSQCLTLFFLVQHQSIFEPLV